MTILTLIFRNKDKFNNKYKEKNEKQTTSDKRIVWFIGYW